MNPTEPRRWSRTWLIPVLGYAISIACLVWVYQGFDWRAELPKLMRTDWRWVGVAVAVDIGVYIIQGWRWSLLLRPLVPVGLWRATQAIYIGLFANEVLPLRSGEIIRTYLMAKWTGQHFSLVVSSVLMERVLDGVWLVIGLYAATRFVEMPGYLVTGSEVLALLLVVALALVVFAAVHKTAARQAVQASRWRRPLREMVDGIHIMGRSRDFPKAVIASFLYMALQVVPVYALVRGYGLDAQLGQAALVFLVLRVATIVPGLPSNLGTFQAATILGLRLVGITGSDATGFATLLFVVITVPLWIGGFVALVATRMRLLEIHTEARKEMG